MFALDLVMQILDYVNLYITYHPQHSTTMRRGDQGAHIRERLTANRSDLTLQGGPNQHGTQKALSDSTDQPFPSPPRTTEPPHLHIVSRALRETTKNKLMHPNSPRPLDSP